MTNAWSSGGSMARKITIAAGIWGGGAYMSGLYVKEETSDPAGNFSDIKIVASNNPGSPIGIYVKYNRNAANTIKFCFKSCGAANVQNILKKETPSGDLELTYSLHTSGLYVNGQSVV